MKHHHWPGRRGQWSCWGAGLSSRGLVARHLCVTFGVIGQLQVSHELINAYGFRDCKVVSLTLWKLFYQTCKVVYDNEMLLLAYKMPLFDGTELSCRTVRCLKVLYIPKYILHVQ